MAWDVKAAALKLLLLPRPPNEAAADLVDLQREIEGALAAMPDGVIVDIHIDATADGFRAIVFYTQPETPSRGLGFR